MIILHFISSPIGGTINFEIIFYIVTAQKSKYAAHSINIYWVLTDVAELVGHHSAWRNAAGSIPGQGTCLGCKFSSDPGACKRQPIDVSLSH